MELLFYESAMCAKQLGTEYEHSNIATKDLSKIMTTIIKETLFARAKHLLFDKQTYKQPFFS